MYSCILCNCVDPDQTPRSAASDLGLHCLQRLIIIILFAFIGCQEFSGVATHGNFPFRLFPFRLLLLFPFNQLYFWE